MESEQKVAFGVGVLVAILLVILLPLVLTGGDDSVVKDLGFEDTEIFSEGETHDNTEGTVAEPQTIVTESPSSAPSLSPTAAPRTIAPVTTQTACWALNSTSVNSTHWYEIAGKIVGESANDLSGLNIAMSADGSIVAIGAPLNSGMSMKAGHVRVYQYDNAGGYVQLGQDIDGENEFDWFGISVALDASGHRLAVGGRWADTQHGTDTGHVRVYDFSESFQSWEKVGADLEGHAEGDQYGRAVALSADGLRLVVGASHTDASANRTDVGHVYIYELKNGLAVPMGELQGDNEEDFSGATLALSEDGNHLAIAATLHDAPNGLPDVGQVKIFRYESQMKQWAKIGSSIEGMAAGAQAGLTVGISHDGSRVAVSFAQISWASQPLGLLESMS